MRLPFAFLFLVAIFAQSLSLRALPADAPDLPVFGSDLFKGQFSKETFTGFNPDYQLAIGDKVHLQIWGALQYSETLTIDNQGNLFIPEAGPLRVQGMRNAELIPALKQKVSEKFINNVDVYANLTTAQPVKVFVGGNVRFPGLYAGHAADNLLYFLDMAGGIDDQSGSFLDITHKRGGEVLRAVNLYDFLLEGNLPARQFADGDIVFVARRKFTLSVVGQVHKPYQFEFSENPVTGERLLELAHPLPNATHLLVRREKSGQSKAQYIPVGEIPDHSFLPGDELSFVSESLPQTIGVEVTGEHIGPTRIVLPYPATLQDALDQLQPGPRSNLTAIGLYRKAIAARQRIMLQESLDNLERKILTARSATAEETQIRANEAEMLLKFIERARDTKPKGQVILTNPEANANVDLEDGDTIHIPKLSNLVLIHGEVLYPNAQVHNTSTSLKQYIESAGGFTANADPKQVLIVHPDGSIDNPSEGKIPLGPKSSKRGATLDPGDEILVLPKADVKSLQIAKDLTQILYHIAVSTKVVLDL